MKLVNHLKMVYCDSYVTGTYTLVLCTAEVKRDISRVPWHTLEYNKQYYSTDHSAIISHKWDENYNWFEMEYIYDWGKRHDEEWRFNEAAIKNLLTEDEWQSLMEEGILEPKQCYLEAHQRRDGWWGPNDYFTRIEVL